LKTAVFSTSEALLSLNTAPNAPKFLWEDLWTQNWNFEIIEIFREKSVDFRPLDIS
jgi:hypothetical protein